MHEVIRSDSDEQVARRHDRSWLKQAQGRGAVASRPCTLARVSGLSAQRHLSAASFAENGIINKNASTRRQAHGRDYSATWFGVVVFVSFMRTSTEHVAFCWLVRHDYGSGRGLSRMPCGWVSSETGGRDCALSGRDLRVFFFYWCVGGNISRNVAPWQTKRGGKDANVGIGDDNSWTK